MPVHNKLIYLRYVQFILQIQRFTFTLTATSLFRRKIVTVCKESSNAHQRCGALYDNRNINYILKITTVIHTTMKCAESNIFMKSLADGDFQRYELYLFSSTSFTTVPENNNYMTK